MPAPAKHCTPSTSRRPTGGRAVALPSAELRQGLRLAVLHPSSAAQRAETVQDLVEEMVEATTHQAGSVTAAELVSCAAVSSAVAAHVDRMRRLPTSPGTAEAAGLRSRP